MDEEGGARLKRAKNEGGKKKGDISRHTVILYYSVSEILSSNMQASMRLFFSSA